MTESDFFDVTVDAAHLSFVNNSVLQMAVLEIQSNGDSSYVSQEAINSAIQSLEDPLQRVRWERADN